LNNNQKRSLPYFHFFTLRFFHGAISVTCLTMASAPQFTWGAPKGIRLAQLSSRERAVQRHQPILGNFEVREVVEIKKGKKKTPVSIKT
jgi:hypothetical protein